MKTQRYTLLLVFTVMGCLLLTADAFAQRGRYRGPGRGGYYNRYYGPRVYSYNRPFVSLRFGGINYRYQYGYFYRPYGSVFRVSVPPFGVRIGMLPPGYSSIYVGPNPYYYYNGIYYRSAPNRQYEVVAPPLGATVRNLPPGAKVAVIDGQKYYELDGTYYEEAITPENELEYTVVGTDGVLNTTGESDSDSTAQEEAPVPAGPQMGDRLDNLPTDAKAVVIQGQKYYTTSSGLYYKEVVEGNKVYYEVVGK